MTWSVSFTRILLILQQGQQGSQGSNREQGTVWEPHITDKITEKQGKDILHEHTEDYPLDCLMIMWD